VTSASGTGCTASGRLRVYTGKSCDHCAAQKIPCVIDGIWVSNWKWQDMLGAEGLRPQKRSRVEVEELDVESEWSGHRTKFQESQELV